MSGFPTSSEIQSWFPQRWSEIAGNRELVAVWKEFILNGPSNTLFTGPSRTGKTRTIQLGLCALACTNRTETLDPCGSCKACKITFQGRTDHGWLFSSLAGSEYSFFPVDCGRVTVDQLENLDDHIDLESNKSIIYLDEIAAIKERKLERHLRKVVDESPAIWFGSAISLKRKRSRKTGKIVEKISEEMMLRFPTKVGTSFPHPVDLEAWLEDRCRAWNISIADKEQTIPEMISRAKYRVGVLLHLFTNAAMRSDRTISLELVRNHNFSAKD